MTAIRRPSRTAEAKSTQTLIKAEETGNVVTMLRPSVSRTARRGCSSPPATRSVSLICRGEIVMLHEVAHNVRIIHMD